MVEIDGVTIYEIELENCGQDLKTLYVSDGIVLFSGNVQRQVWEARELSAATFQAGDKIEFAEATGVAEIPTYTAASVRAVTCTLNYTKWLAEVDRLAWEHWSERAYTGQSGAHGPGDPWIEAYLDGATPEGAWEEEILSAGE